MIKSIIYLLLTSSFAFDPSIMVLSQSASARQGSEKISGWEDFTVEKGFILSTNLQDARWCRRIWPKQIPNFKEQNPHVKDVDKFYPGDKIRLQTCDDDMSAVAPIKVKKLKKKKKFIVKSEDQSDESNPIVPAVPELIAQAPAPEKKEEVKEKDPDGWDTTDGQLFLGLGFLSESHNEVADTSPALTFRVRTGIQPSLNHRLMLDISPNVIYVRNKLDFKTSPAKYQYFFSVGMGNRIGIKERSDIKMSNKITNYAETSVGFNIKYSSKVNITMETGITVNASYPVNFSVTATKQLGNSEYYLGGYFDYIWTDSSLMPTDTDDRRMLTGGIILSY
jgi:hypothetical protein